jgi:hypothetical protein
VITILHAAVLGSVLCLSTAGPIVQDKQQDPEAIAKVLTLGEPNAEAIRTHRLTAENLRKMFAVERELFTLMKEVPDLETRMSELRRRFYPDRHMANVAVEANVYEAIPETAQILRRHNISAREYVLTNLVASVTAMIDEAVTDEFLQREGDYLMTPALKFWRAMDPDLKAEADEWKKVTGRYGRGRAGFMR